MIVKTSNSDQGISNAGQGPVEKVAPTQAVSAVKNQPERGSKLPDNGVTAERVVGVEETVDAEKLEQALQKINTSAEVVKSELRFSVDEDSGRSVVKIMDLATKEVIRQIPNEQALNFAKQLDAGAQLELFSDYG